MKATSIVLRESPRPPSEDRRMLVVHEASLKATNTDMAFFEDVTTNAEGQPCGAWIKISKCFGSRDAAEAAKEKA